MLQELRSKKATLKLRSKILKEIRSFFEERGFLEVETPFLLPYLIPEAHIDAIKADGGYLHTSPELCMKVLLANGYGNIFQICKCFRKGENGKLHMPEFTMLEWYHVGIDYSELMNECESLLLFLCKKIFNSDQIVYKGKRIDLSPPWERITLEQAFEMYASVSLREALYKDIFEEIMVNEIEPRLGIKKPVFVKDYPVSMAALSQIRNGYAERFELYICGIELANGYSELTDMKEMIKRCEEENKKRKEMGKDQYPIPKDLLSNIKEIPKCAGIALGIDRLVMIFAQKKDIQQVGCSLDIC